MRSSAQKKNINLLLVNHTDNRLGNRILLWILSSFRIIVISTEMIVMLAFLSRFWLDAKNSDLTDEIENRKSLITASLDFEKDFKSTQAKLSVVSNLLKKPEFYPTLNSLSAYVPTGVTVNQMTVSEEKINLQGQTASEPQLMLFITNLYSSDNFKNANLTSLKSAADTAFLDFELTINLGPEKES